MRLPDYVKSCVCFLCVEDGGRTRFGGTAFFASVDSKVHPGLTSSYLVTAKHCVNTAYAKYHNLKARVNAEHRSQSKLVDLRQSWQCPNDPGVDIAALSVNIHPGIEVVCLPIESFVDDSNVDFFGIGIGDSTSTVGLFTQREGKS